MNKRLTAIERWNKHFYTMYILNIIMFLCFFLVMGLCLVFAYLIKFPVIYLNDRVFHRLYKFFKDYADSKPAHMIFIPRKSLKKVNNER